MVVKDPDRWSICAVLIRRFEILLYLSGAGWLHR